MRHFAVSMFALAALSAPVFRQGHRAIIRGPVSDPPGTDGYGATVRVTQWSTNVERLTRSSETGWSEVPGLLPDLRRHVGVRGPF